MVVRDPDCQCYERSPRSGPRFSDSGRVKGLGNRKEPVSLMHFDLHSETIAATNVDVLCVIVHSVRVNCCGIFDVITYDPRHVNVEALQASAVSSLRCGSIFKRPRQLYPARGPPRLWKTRFRIVLS